MNASVISRIVPLLNQLLRLEDGEGSCGCCDQNTGGFCCELYGSLMTILDENITDKELRSQTEEDILNDIVGFVARNSHLVAQTPESSDDEEDDPCPVCDEPESECEEAGGFTSQCRY
jgi:hypothetical protein